MNKIIDFLHRNTDVEQATIRLGFGVLGFAYALEASSTGRTSWPLSDVLTVGVAFLAIALMLLTLTWLHGGVVARLTGMVMDIGSTSYVISMVGDAGYIFLPVYLWVIVGNGLRFGFTYLVTATALSIIGVVYVFTSVSGWGHSPYLASSWLLALLVLPVYFAVLLRRLQIKTLAIERLSQHMELLARHDALTGLPNRSAFDEYIKCEIERARTHSLSFAIAFVDLDGFKAVNDIYGHDAGDVVIKHAANRVKAAVRTNDFVARLGGDEFVILLPCTTIELRNNVERAIEKVLASLAAPFVIGERSVALSASIGISFYPMDGVDLQSLLRRADEQMYQVKRSGKNGYRTAAG